MPDYRKMKDGEELEGGFVTDVLTCAANYPTGSWVDDENGKEKRYDPLEHRPLYSSFHPDGVFGR